MTERGLHFGQQDDQNDLHGYDAAPHTAFDLPQHADPDLNDERDSRLIRLARMQRNLRLTEQLYATSPTGNFQYKIDIDENNREYLNINKTFLNGQRRAVQAAWESLAMPQERIDGEWVHVDDEIGKQMANEVILETDKEYKLL